MQIHQRLIINRISCNKFMHCENTENVIIFQIEIWKIVLNTK